jgi:hypothetical protein
VPVFVLADEAFGEGSVVHEADQVQGGAVDLGGPLVSKGAAAGPEPGFGGLGEALLRSVEDCGFFKGLLWRGAPAVTGAGGTLREGENLAWGAHGGVLGVRGLCC